MSPVQGSVLPRMLGYGYWRYGAIFFIAMEIVEGLNPSRRLQAALPAAEKVYSMVHRALAVLPSTSWAVDVMC